MSLVNLEAATWSQASTAVAVVRALLTGDVLALQDLTHPDVVDHNSAGEQPSGWTALRERALTVCAALPEGVTVELVMSEGDTAVCRVRAPGYRRGTPQAADGSTELVTVLFVLRFRDGRTGEIWSSSDLSPLFAYAAA
jgi:predicted ester cyclase